MAENVDLQLDMKRPQLEKVIGSHEAKGNITKIGQLVSTKRTYFQHKPMYMAENGGSSNLENTSLELGPLDENNVGKVKNSSFIDTKIDSNSNGDEILAKSQRKSPSRMLKNPHLAKDRYSLEKESLKTSLLHLDIPYSPTTQLKEGKISRMVPLGGLSEGKPNSSGKLKKTQGKKEKKKCLSNSGDVGAGNASFNSIKSYFKKLQCPTEDVGNKRLGDRLSCETSAESEGSKPVLGPNIARFGAEKHQRN